MSIISKGQDYPDKIITNEKDTIICRITSIGKQLIKYNFLDIFQGGKIKRYNYYVNLSNVLSYEWNSKYTLNSTLKDRTLSQTLTSGDHLIKGGTYMLVGISISTLGSLTSMYLSSPSYIKNYYPMENSYLIGVVSGIIGTTLNIVGIVHIIKSGKKHNEYEKNMSLHLKPTQNGIGICLKL